MPRPGAAAWRGGRRVLDLHPRGGSLARRITADAGRERRALIEAFVRGIGYTCYWCAGECADPAPALLMLGIGEEAAIRLGAMLEQPTVLVGRRGHSPELRSCVGSRGG